MKSPSSSKTPVGFVLANWTDGTFISTVDTFLLEVNDGGWTTIPSTEYVLHSSIGEIAKRDYDSSSGASVEWDDALSYRCTYTKINSTTLAETTYTQEAQTLTYLDEYVPSADTGELHASAPRNLVVQEIFAGRGLIGKWTINKQYLARDTGVDATSGGMAPLDYPFYAGATYANRASANFRVTPAGDVTMAGSLTVGGSVTISGSVTVSGSMQSDDYVANQKGWKIAASGKAEFRDIEARGEFHAAVFVKNLIKATAGSEIIAKSAGTLKSAVTTATSPTTFNVDIKDPPTGHAALFAANDILRLKDEAGSDVWVTVSSVSDQTTFYRYVCVKSNGSNATFYPGTAVIDYGASGQGFLFLTADDSDGPFYSIRTHAGSPWSATTERGRFGNMKNAFGTGANNYYGFGVGDYAGGNYLKYETNGGFVFRAGAGAVMLDTTGIKIDKGSGAPNSITWSDFSAALTSFVQTYGDISGGQSVYTVVASGAVGDATIGAIQHQAVLGAGSLTQIMTSQGYWRLYGSAGIAAQMIIGSSGNPSSNIHIVDAAPSFRMEDSTASAKSLLVKVDANKATWGNTTPTTHWVHDLSTGAVHFKGGPTYDIVAFGAVGDDATDNTSFIQAAIDAAETAGGGIVFIPVGVFRVTSALTLKSNVSTVGTGWGSVVKGAFGSDNTYLFKTATATRTTNIEVNNFRVQLGTSTYPNAAFHLTRTSGFSASSIFMDDTDVPSDAATKRHVVFDLYSSNHNAKITNCNTKSGGMCFVRGAGSSVNAGTITGAADNGSGLIRITDANHGLVTGDSVHIEAVIGTTEANGDWDNITVIDADTFDLVDSVFTNAYVSGGSWSERTFDVHIVGNTDYSIVDENVAVWGWHGTVSHVSISNNTFTVRNPSATTKPIAIFDADIASGDAAARCNDVSVTGNTLASNGKGLQLLGNHASGFIKNVTLVGNTIKQLRNTHTDYGIQEEYNNGASGTITNVVISGNTIEGFSSGIVTTTIEARANTIKDCGTASLPALAVLEATDNKIVCASAAVEGIRLRAEGSAIGNRVDGGTSGIRVNTLSNVRILGNYVKNTTTAINVTGAGSGAIIEGNDVATNNTNKITVSTHTPRSIRGNNGYVTEASGTGSIASGATTATVTHGLAVTPTIDDIFITFGEQGTNAYGRFWVDTIGATTFKLNVTADPGASNLDFGWRAVAY